jgi:hypothetical protein
VLMRDTPGLPPTEDIIAEVLASLVPPGA